MRPMGAVLRVTTRTRDETSRTFASTTRVSPTTTPFASSMVFVVAVPRREQALLRCAPRRFRKHLPRPRRRMPTWKLRGNPKTLPPQRSGQPLLPPRRPGWASSACARVVTSRRAHANADHDSSRFPPVSNCCRSFVSRSFCFELFVRKRHFGDARVLCGEGDRGGEGAALSSSRVPQMSRVICDRTWDVIREPRPTETGSADVAPQGPKLRSLHPPPRREYVPTVQRQPGLFPLRGGAQEHEVQRARGADSHPPRGHRNPRVRRSRDDGGVETRFASIVAKGTCCISQIPPTVLPKLVTVVHTSRYTILTLFWQNSKGEPGFDVLQHVPPDAAARG